MAIALVRLALVQAAGEGELPRVPTGLAARGGDRSVLLHWSAESQARVGGYRVYRADRIDGEFTELTRAPVAQQAYADNHVDNGRTYHYRVAATDATGLTGAQTSAVSCAPGEFSDDDAFLDFLQYAAFQYFWREANPVNGLVRDRSRPDSVSSIAATGFGLTALGIGIDRGWITRAEGRERAVVTLRTFWDKPQGNTPEGCIGYRGWFYHFLDMTTGLRTWTCELSSIDTALLLAGVLDVRNYFDAPTDQEQSIRILAGQIFNRVDWQYLATDTNTLSMGWRPESGFIPARWIGYNEGMILYLLGLGAAKHPLAPEYWTGWTGGYHWASHFGQDYLVFAPLFGHQYSHCWIDFRGLADGYMQQKGITYFENSRRATLAQQAYCAANPGGFGGYSGDLWGLTACDGPGTAGYQAYSARGAPPAENDDGTIAPTAVGGSLPFAPEICLPTLRRFYDQFRSRLWMGYGFRDAFNLTADWWGPDALGIDQGPILIMAENYRTESVWRRFMREPIVQRGLVAAGFRASANRSSDIRK